MSLSGRTTTTKEFNLEAVKGTALSGARYVETAEESIMWNRDLDMVPQTGNYKSNVLMTRLGEDGAFVLGDDSYTMVLMHYTVNANGTTTVDRLDVTITCR